MDIEFAMLARYKKLFVPLEDVCEEYFRIGPKKAKQMVAAGDFPIPVTRTRSSQKSPYLINVADLALYLKEQYERSCAEFQRMRNV
ncbi:pyocin activator PrtN family protein [Endozoicomonas sp. SCSIO W0465]|uniref:pyocin activator PrtN family protein n=1 Tax=Endozoicomonas sp. SCSIO W0465 TaxID=2918516 RepID=UPI002075B993|nr:pyocin activator PrtN family protein [Endozoicomonas sp. SCSIO W0465]USE37653.1 pyocin activator PrtN family protein [Endozoicomonas sp. SCSIO W0465]